MPGISIENLLKEAGVSSRQTVREAVLATVGQDGAEALDKMEARAAQLGHDLYQTMDAEKIASIVLESKGDAQNEEGSNMQIAGQPNHSTKIASQYDAEENPYDQFLSKEAQVQAIAYGNLVGQAQAAAMIEALQKTAEPDEVTLEELAAEPAIFDKLASQHAHDILVLTQYLEPEKVAEIEGLEEDRPLVMELNLDDRAFQAIGEAAYQKIAAAWPDYVEDIGARLEYLHANNGG